MSLFPGMRARHLALIAANSTRYALRSGTGIMFVVVLFYLGLSPSAGVLTMLDEQGHAQLAYVRMRSAVVPGPTPDCGWLVTDRPVPIPMRNGGVGQWGWIVRVVWLSAVDNAGWVSAGEQRVPVLLSAGLNETFVQVSGAVDTVTVELADPTHPVCIPQIEVGDAVILPPAMR